MCILLVYRIYLTVEKSIQRIQSSPVSLASLHFWSVSEELNFASPVTRFYHSLGLNFVSGVPLLREAKNDHAVLMYWIT